MTNEVLNLLKKSEAIIFGHFVFTSGKHAPRYVNKMALFAHPIYASKMGILFAKKYQDKKIDVVVAPALGGIILSTWTAYHLSKLNKKDIIGIYTEKTPEKQQIFTRGYDKYVNNKNILIVEDVVTTGGSVRKVVDSVKKAGGKIIEVCSIANLNENPTTITDKVIGAKFSYLTALPVTTYDEKNCPLCKQNVPINTVVGHGAQFVAKRTNPPSKP